MLVLTRKAGQAIWIGDDIRIVITDVDRNKVRVGIEAPMHVKIMREEITDGKQRGDEDAAP